MYNLDLLEKGGTYNLQNHLRMEFKKLLLILSCIASVCYACNKDNPSAAIATPPLDTSKINSIACDWKLTDVCLIKGTWELQYKTDSACTIKEFPPSNLKRMNLVFKPFSDCNGSGCTKLYGQTDSCTFCWKVGNNGTFGNQVGCFYNKHWGSDDAAKWDSIFYRGIGQNHTDYKFSDDSSHISLTTPYTNYKLILKKVK